MSKNYLFMQLFLWVDVHYEMQGCHINTYKLLEFLKSPNTRNIYVTRRLYQSELYINVFLRNILKFWFNGSQSFLSILHECKNKAITSNHFLKNIYCHKNFHNIRVYLRNLEILGNKKKQFRQDLVGFVKAIPYNIFKV